MEHQPPVQAEGRFDRPTLVGSSSTTVSLMKSAPASSVSVDGSTRTIRNGGNSWVCSRNQAATSQGLCSSLSPILLVADPHVPMLLLAGLNTAGLLRFWDGS